jgi:hypothetical protein
LNSIVSLERSWKREAMRKAEGQSPRLSAVLIWSVFGFISGSAIGDHANYDQTSLDCDGDVMHPAETRCRDHWLAFGHWARMG